MTLAKNSKLRTDIKNILFDLGGVILEIDYRLTREAFERIGGPNFGFFYSQQGQSDLFDRLEVGKITADDFRKEAKKALGIHDVSDEDFDVAWNAMIITYKNSKLEFLKDLSTSYQLYLFSNTNEIHYRHFATLYAEVTGESFELFNSLFKRTYYSHLFGQRKPHQLSFERILRENNLKPEETLFVDDSPQHLLGAKAAGLQTLLMTKENDIFKIPAFIGKTEP